MSGWIAKLCGRYTNAAELAGLVRDGDTGQLTDELIGAVVEAVRPDRPDGHGVAWEMLCANHDQIVKWVGKGLMVVKIGCVNPKWPQGDGARSHRGQIRPGGFQ